jgi:hypothetical protein
MERTMGIVPIITFHKEPRLPLFLLKFLIDPTMRK